jgi:AmiR/NasT family two-component response regulator
MNTFHTSPSLDSLTGMLGQALADIATVVIVQTGSLTADQITDRVQQALQARTAIEQAKGVLAYTRKLEMAAAYELLRELAASSQATLSATAAAVIAQAQRRT